MLKNYLKIALRNLQRNASISFINIFGLPVGMAVTPPNADLDKISAKIAGLKEKNKPNKDSIVV